MICGLKAKSKFLVIILNIFYRYDIINSLI
nr:MAG TPA: hypothetical protein [Caudoviricetes sp.]